MREVDGFTLIDYIKSSIEILMNMKIEEGNDGDSPGGKRHHDRYGDIDYDELEEEEAEERRRRR